MVFVPSQHSKQHCLQKFQAKLKFCEVTTYAFLSFFLLFQLTFYLFREEIWKFILEHLLFAWKWQKVLPHFRNCLERFKLLPFCPPDFIVLMKRCNYSNERRKARVTIWWQLELSSVVGDCSARRGSSIIIGKGNSGIAVCLLVLARPGKMEIPSARIVSSIPKQSAYPWRKRYFFQQQQV